MTDHIESHSQSGGITAKNVTVGGTQNIFQVSESRSRTTKGRSMWKYVGGAIAFAASVFGILQFFGISAESEKPKVQQQVSIPPSGGAMKEKSAQKNEAKIISNNQSGGITAHTVNVGTVNMGPQPRMLNDQLAQQLLAAIPQGKLVTVVAVMGDQEAFQFATQVKNFLASREYNVSGVDQAVYTQPIIGQHINLKGDGVEIVIGGHG